MLLRNLSDEELMARYQLGSEEAFSMLYERHSSKVYGFVRKRISEPEIADEVFQEVFVKLHRSKHLYNSTLPYLPWLFSISRSVVLDSVKARKKLSSEIRGQDLDKFETLERSESSRYDLQPYLAGLPPAQRDAVELRYVSEKTFDEIATVLNTSPVNIRQLISRGVKRLKELVSEGDSHERRRK